MSSPHVTRSGSKIFVYAEAYADIFFWKRESHVMDLPVLAAHMAKELWSMLFERMDARSNETAQNATTAFRECFRRAYFPHAASDEYDGLAERAAALGTVVEAADPLRWKREVLLAANAPISEGRLFLSGVGERHVCRYAAARVRYVRWRERSVEAHRRFRCALQVS
ncbi:hypothetical protein MRX96_051979 [Rhipicephalus microplus]